MCSTILQNEDSAANVVVFIIEPVRGYHIVSVPFTIIYSSLSRPYDHAVVFVVGYLLAPSVQARLWHIGSRGRASYCRCSGEGVSLPGPAGSRPAPVQVRLAR